MGRALELARAGVGLASPNPMVGCVLVRDGVVVGEGAHVYDVLDHAEIVALKQAGDAARGATAYVTLEPCSHRGRTGPCADALIAAGVRRVVAATVDANPVVRGAGLARLQAAGVEVRMGVLEDTARAINDGFAKFIRTGRPLVVLKAAVSADGMIAPAAVSRVAGEPFWITGVEARAEVQRMRHAADAVLTGIGTVVADDPLLTDRSGGARRRKLLRVVLDSELRLGRDSKLVRSADGDVVVICGDDADMGRALALEELGVEVVRVGVKDGRLDLAAVMDLLGGRKILNLLLECGSELNGAFLRDGLVDRVVMFRAQMRLCDGGVPFAAGVRVEDVEGGLMGVSRVRFGEDERVIGVLRDAWSELTKPDFSAGL